MKTFLSCLFSGLLLLGSSGCIYVRVTGDLDEGFWDDGEDDRTAFHDLSQAVEGCLADPAYDLDLSASPWHMAAEWTVRYASAGSDGHAAFCKVKEALLARIEREGGTVTSQREDGPHDWSCSFRLEDESGSAAVHLVENAGKDAARPHQLEVAWKEPD